MSRRRLDVTATQAVASMMAALTGAIAASGLGIAGTIIGAAFMSLASTVGAAVYKHYLARSNERLRAAATNLAPKASSNAVAAAVLRHHLHLHPDETAHLRPEGQAVVAARADGGAQSAELQPAAKLQPAAELQPPAELQPAAKLQPAAGRRAGGPARPDSADARIRPALAGADRPGRHARPGDVAGAGAEAPAAAAWAKGNFAAAAVAADIAAAVLGDHTALRHASLGYTGAEHPAVDPADDDDTTAEPRPTADLAAPASLRPAPDLGNAADPAAAGRGLAAGGRGRPRRRWLRLAGAVLAVFVVAMGAVTAVEAIAGKPLETLIWHRAGTGTTIGSVVGHPAGHQPAIVPSHSPAPSQSPSTQPSSTSPGPASPTPTPSQSTAPSPGTSSAPGAGTSGGTGTQAPGTTAPGQ